MNKKGKITTLKKNGWVIVSVLFFLVFYTFAICCIYELCCITSNSHAPYTNNAVRPRKSTKNPNELKLFQWNIRTSDPSFENGNKLHFWENRRNKVERIIKNHLPFTIAGISEGHIQSYDDLQSMFANNYHFHHCRTRAIEPFGDNNVKYNLYNIIIWNTNELKLITNGDFELSDTPMNVNTRNNNTKDYRCVAWSYFQLQNGKYLLFLSTHIDTTIDMIAKMNQIEMIELFIDWFYYEYKNDANMFARTNEEIDTFMHTINDFKKKREKIEKMDKNFKDHFEHLPFYVLITADWNEPQKHSQLYRAMTHQNSVNNGKAYSPRYQWIDLIEQCRNQDTCIVKRDSECTAHGYYGCQEWEKLAIEKMKNNPLRTYFPYFYDWPYMIDSFKSTLVTSVDIDSTDATASDHFPIITQVML